jgi:hypothetical protein
VRARAGLAALVAGCLACGGGTPSGPAASASAAPTPPPRANLSELSGSASSRESGRVINCREDVTAQVRLTNRAVSPVAVTGVRRTTRVLSGGCSAARDFVYARLPQVAGPGRTTLVMDEPLFLGGSGCCAPGGSCDGRFTCSIEDTLTILTAPGQVAAGSYVYQVNFRDCTPCAAVAAAAATPKPAPPSR